MSSDLAAGIDRHALAEDNRDDTGDLRLWLVRVMLLAALGLIMLVRLLSAQQEGLPWLAAVAAMIPYAPMVALLLGPHTLRVRIVLLVALALLYATPFVIVGGHWDWLPWPLAVAALCAFRGRVGWPLFGIILALTYAAGMWSGDDSLTALARTYKTATDGLIGFGLYALVTMVAQLHATRGEQASLQLGGERRRLRGDLGAVLGSQLRVLEQQLTEAVDADPATAQDRLGVALEIAREALRGVRRAAGTYRSSPTATGSPIQSPRVARLTLAALYLCQSLMVVVYSLSYYHRPWTLLLVVPVICAAAVVLLLMRPSRRQMILLGLLLIPTAVALDHLVWELNFLSLLWPFLLGLILARVRRPWSWAIFAAALALEVAIIFYPPPVPNLAGMAADLISIVILSWVSYSLIRLSELVTVMHQTRRDLARETLVRERTRVARDLHDVLSFSLSAVLLKGELCQRLLQTDQQLAREQLATLPELAARALAELEAVAHRPATLRTQDEVVAARAVLETAGVRSNVTFTGAPLAANVDSALAAVLREAVTNIVRHSQARTCTIAITTTEGSVRLRVVNDGVSGVALPSVGTERGGAGLVGIAERTGGHMSARALPNGRFELVAEFMTDPTDVSVNSTDLATDEAF